MRPLTKDHQYAQRRMTVVTRVEASCLQHIGVDASGEATAQAIDVASCNSSKDRSFGIILVAAARRRDVVAALAARLHTTRPLNAHYAAVEALSWPVSSETRLQIKRSQSQVRLYDASGGQKAPRRGDLGS